jgi:ubiquinone/menaquinone biosynthesis C-methylase UbiE
MGRWSRGTGKVFLDWIAPPRGAHWLDVGCGTGSFTELIAEICAPASIFAVDPERAQINHARNRPIANKAHFEVADAASGLVPNFIPDRPRPYPRCCG